MGLFSLRCGHGCTAIEPLATDARNSTVTQMPQVELKHGDNRQVMLDLLEGCERRFRLVYLDPPFDTGLDWKTKEGESALRSFLGQGFMEMMEDRPGLVRQLLTEDGSLFLHCDYRRSPHLQLLCDRVLGRVRGWNRRRLDFETRSSGRTAWEARVLATIRESTTTSTGTPRPASGISTRLGYRLPASASKESSKKHRILGTFPPSTTWLKSARAIRLRSLWLCSIALSAPTLSRAIGWPIFSADRVRRW